LIYKPPQLPEIRTPRPQDEGVNLAGIKRIIELTNEAEPLQSRLAEMAAEIEALRANQRCDIAVVPKSTP
jgi:MerR family transcriptional regulator/heat shock protein HspR